MIGKRPRLIYSGLCRENLPYLQQGIYMAVKIKPADTAFSKCVRARNNWTCEKCGKQYEENSTGLHCSHVFSRRYRNIRWCGDNAQALCFSCHQWYGSNPADSGKWVEGILGQGVIDLLREKRNLRIKVSKQDEKDIAKHYREELKKLKQRRNEGERGRIDFESWQ